MKNLLKISLVLVAVIAVLATLATTVNAATSKEFVEHVTEKQKIAGKEVTLVNKATKNALEKYLENNQFDSYELDYLKKAFDRVVVILDEAEVTDLTKLEKEDKAKIAAIADEISANLNIKYTVKEGKIRVYYREDVKKFEEISNPVKQTGSANYVYLVPVVAVVAVAIALVSKKTLTNAR